MFIHGGYDGRAWRNDTVALNVDTATWEAVAPAASVLPPPRASAPLGVLSGGRMILYGGYNGERNDMLSDLWILHTVDVTTGGVGYRWQQVRPPVPAPGAGPATGAPAMLAAGGGAASSANVAGVADERGALLPPAPLPVLHGSGPATAEDADLIASVLGDAVATPAAPAAPASAMQLHQAGVDASNAAGANTANATAAAIAAGTWPMGRSGHTLKVIDEGRVVLLTGGRVKTGRVNDTWVFDSETQVWHQVRTTGTAYKPRKTGASAVLPVGKDSAKLILFGGHDGERWLNDMHVLDLEAVLRALRLKRATATTIAIPDASLGMDLARTLLHGDEEVAAALASGLGPAAAGAAVSDGLLGLGSVIAPGCDRSRTASGDADGGDDADALAIVDEGIPYSQEAYRRFFVAVVSNAGGTGVGSLAHGPGGGEGARASAMDAGPGLFVGVGRGISELVDRVSTPGAVRRAADAPASGSSSTRNRGNSGGAWSQPVAGSPPSASPPDGGDAGGLGGRGVGAAGGDGGSAGGSSGAGVALNASYYQSARGRGAAPADDDFGAALSDVTIHVEGRQFKLHRIILAARSEYFRTMFTGPFAESSARDIALDDMDAASFVEIVRHIYTDALPSEEALRRGLVLPLLRHSQALGLPRLSRVCQRFLEAHLRPDSACASLETADALGLVPLRRACMRYVLANYSSVSCTAGFVSLREDLLREVLARRAAGTATLLAAVPSSMGAARGGRVTEAAAHVRGLAMGPSDGTALLQTTLGTQGTQRVVPVSTTPVQMLAAGAGVAVGAGALAPPNLMSIATPQVRVPPTYTDNAPRRPVPEHADLPSAGVGAASADTPPAQLHAHSQSQSLSHSVSRSHSRRLELDEIDQSAAFLDETLAGSAHDTSAEGADSNAQSTMGGAVMSMEVGASPAAAASAGTPAVAAAAAPPPPPSSLRLPAEIAVPRSSTASGIAASGVGVTASAMTMAMAASPHATPSFSAPAPPQGGAGAPPPSESGDAAARGAGGVQKGAHASGGSAFDGQ